MQARGDFLLDDPQMIAQKIQEIDPNNECLILATAGPPCPDFSVVNDSGRGRHGPEGSKFVSYCHLLDNLAALLPEHRFETVTENVVMEENAEVAYFSRALHASPVLIDSADLGVVNRPRLWWTKIDWSQARNNPYTGRPFTWSKSNKIHKLTMDLPMDDANALQLDGCVLHPDVVSHTKRVACFTTPAPTPEGHPAPKRMKGTIDPMVKQRWLSDGRRYAPWAYEETSMMRDHSGQLQILSAEAKEQLHGYDPAYTACGSISDHDRHKMLANSWHLKVIIFVLVILLQQVCVVSAPLLDPQRSRPPRRTTLQYMITLASHHPALIGPGPWPIEHATVPPAMDAVHHWSLAQQASHPADNLAKPEPALQQTMQLWSLHRPDLCRLREEVTQDVLHLIQEMDTTTDQWWESLEPHIKQVYWDQELQQRTQIPTFVYLLRSLGYPATDTLERDLTEGFDIIGQLPPGPGWRPRTDQRYSFPIDMTAFRKLNQAYIDKKLRQQRPDSCWQALLKEILQEIDLGRMDRPYSGPDHWKTPCHAPPGLSLKPCPDQNLASSLSFAVVQVDKIRRCEDFRRSHHNDLLQVWDTPHHHDIGSHISIAKAFNDLGHPCSTWCQDLNSAYRQFPLKCPSHAYTLLICPFGATLWKHHCLAFGASGSVWSFNRAADAMTFAARRLWLAPITHYVDDFSCTEATETNQSSYAAFETTFQHLGLRMKAKKAQPPDTTQKVLGVMLQHQDNAIEIATCPKRAGRMTTMLQEILANNYLDPDTAHRVAGKLLFLQLAIYGQVGKATLAPIYARAANTNPEPHNLLTHALRAAIKTVLALIQNNQPRLVPFNSTAPVTVIYTDAFFQQGDKTYKIGSSAMPTQWSTRRCPSYTNGWGYVVTINGKTYFEHGTVPSFVLKRFCSRRAFIYFLEILAHFMALFSLRQHITKKILAYIDNKAGHSAILRGYGRDPSINNLLACLWNFHQLMSLQTHLEWVCSANNISDGVSRGDFQLPKELGWTPVQTNFQSFYDIIIRAADDLEYAAGSAAVDLLQLPAVHQQH